MFNAVLLKVMLRSITYSILNQAFCNVRNLRSIKLNLRCFTVASLHTNLFKNNFSCKYRLDVNNKELLISYPVKSFPARCFCSDVASDFKENSVSQNENSVSQSEKVINVAFINSDGEEVHLKAKVGDNVLDLANDNELDVQGACGGKLSCTCCHVYVDEKYFEILEPSSEREDDLLDSVPLLKENSRLGCQINLTKEMDGIHFRIPDITAHFYVDGYKPKPH